MILNDELYLHGWRAQEHCNHWPVSGFMHRYQLLSNNKFHDRFGQCTVYGRLFRIYATMISFMALYHSVMRLARIIIQKSLHYTTCLMGHSQLLRLSKTENVN